MDAIFKLHGQLPLPGDYFTRLASMKMKTPLEVSEVPVKLQEKDVEGGEMVAAVAWDETVGRAMFVSPDSGMVRVVDFAHMPMEGM